MAETGVGTPSAEADVSHERVQFEVTHDHVGVLTLTRPEKLNAMDEAMFAALHAAADTAAAAIADRTCRAVLMIGSGRAFSAGTDLAALGSQPSQAPDDDHIAWLQAAFTRWEDLAAPVVAAIHGVALGAGCQLALAAHLRVVAPDAQIGVLETRWGILPDLGASYRLPPLIGRSRAIEMAVSARRIDAPTALEWGLANAILAKEGFAAAARQWAATLAAGPPLATGAIPALMRRAAVLSRDEALRAERVAQAPLLRSEDFRTAISAGLAGEQANFAGK